MHLTLQVYIVVHYIWVLHVLLKIGRNHTVNIWDRVQNFLPNNLSLYFTEVIQRLSTQPHFHEWLCLHSLLHLWNLTSNSSPYNISSLWFPGMNYIYPLPSTSLNTFMCSVCQSHQLVWTLLCVQSVSLLSRWSDFWFFTDIICCRASWVCACLFPVFFCCVGVTIIGNFGVLRPRTVMVMQPLTLQLCLVAISWWSARPMHLVEELII